MKNCPCRYHVSNSYIVHHIFVNMQLLNFCLFKHFEKQSCPKFFLSTIFEHGLTWNSQTSSFGHEGCRIRSKQASVALLNVTSTCQGKVGQTCRRFKTCRGACVCTDMLSIINTIYTCRGHLHSYIHIHINIVCMYVLMNACTKQMHTFNKKNMRSISGNNQVHHPGSLKHLPCCRFFMHVLIGKI